MQLSNVIIYLILYCVDVHGYVVNYNFSKLGHSPPIHRLLSQHEYSSTSIENNVEHKSTIHVFTDCNDEIINEVSAFLIDAYWLSTPRLWINENVECNLSTQVSILQESAADYLRSQYGERLGNRLLKTSIVVADGTNDDDATSVIAGLLCMHELVWQNNNILPDEESETLLRDSIASLSPKYRRMYKNASTIDIATKLLPSATKAVCVFSNLAVSPKFRRKGIAQQLCQAAETVAKDWGYEQLHLKVEAENIAAADLYKNKLGYILEQHLPSDPAIRLDLSEATFVDTEVETLILSKKLL